MQNKLGLGKLPPALLQSLLQQLPSTDASLVIPPGLGLDAAGLALGDKLIAVTTDPITFASEQIGTYSVAVNANDVACLGCRPRWYSATLLLPNNIAVAKVTAIWANLAAELKRYGICAIGGHTEVTAAVNTPVIVGQMIGEVIGDKLLDIRNAQVGDKILLWQPIAIEGTALLAREKADFLKKYVSPQQLHDMQQLLFTPGICIWPMVEKLLPCVGVVAIHDPTEGGLATALHELADAAQLGVRIDEAAIPILPETLQLAKLLKFNPFGLLASGSALLICRPDAVAQVMQKLTGEPLVEIGEFTAENSRILFANGKDKELPRYDADEITRVV